MIPGPKSKRILRELHEVECPHVTYVGKDFPIVIKKTFGSKVWDVDNNCYIDLTSFFSVSSLGHANKTLQHTIQKTITNGWHSMGDVHPHELKLIASKQITSLLPKTLSQVFFSNSGSEAVETAFKTAFLYNKKPGIIAFTGAYHGLGYGAMQTTSREYFRTPFQKQTGKWATFKPFIELGKFQKKEIDDYLSDLKRWIRKQSKRPIGAMLIEPIQGRAGIRVAEKAFIKGLRSLSKELGIVLIFDEIFTGFFRTGKAFAFEHYAVIPDLLCLGKGMSNGFPISACIGSKKLFSKWGKSFGEAKHTSTFLGHPLGCAMIDATLKELKKKSLQQRICRTSDFLMLELDKIMHCYPKLIRSVSGKGLMVGMGFYDKRVCSMVLKTLLKEGVILLSSGDDSDVLSFTPAFTISKQELSLCLFKLKRTLKSFQHDSKNSFR